MTDGICSICGKRVKIRQKFMFRAPNVHNKKVEPKHPVWHDRENGQYCHGFYKEAREIT